MKKIKTTVEEVVAVQITEEEFAELAAEECTKMFLEMSQTGEPSSLNVLLPMTCAKFAAHLLVRLFEENNEENEESEENENA